MSTIITPATANLAKALRAHANDEVEASTYILIIARLLEGKTLDEAMGAPGDWGYDTPIGDAVYSLLNEPGHAPRLTVPDDVTAAAPQLLAALEAVLPLVPGVSTNDHGGRPHIPQALAAIAAAKGGA